MNEQELIDNYKQLEIYIGIRLLVDILNLLEKCLN